MPTAALKLPLLAFLPLLLPIYTLEEHEKFEAELPILTLLEPLDAYLPALLPILMSELLDRTILPIEIAFVPSANAEVPIAIASAAFASH